MKKKMTRLSEGVMQVLPRGNAMSEYFKKSDSKAMKMKSNKPAKKRKRKKA